MTEAVPAIEGWFTTGEEPALLGQLCRACGTYQFPPIGEWCSNPACDAEELETVPLSRNGKVWSYTDAQYQPPAPYVSRHDPYEPFAIAAVELEKEAIVVLGQVADGFGVGDLEVGAEVRLVVEALESSEGADRLVWKWRPL